MFKTSFTVAVTCLAGGLLVAPVLQGAPATATRPVQRVQWLLPVDVFMDVFNDDQAKAVAVLECIDANWNDACNAMLTAVIACLGRHFDGDVNASYTWLWSVERPAHPVYAQYKAELYDPLCQTSCRH